jgi:ferrous iron transport protein B
LDAKQMFIATVLLAVSFPCVATFFVFVKELGAKALLKAVGIMLITGVILGVLLNFVVMR